MEDVRRRAARVGGSGARGRSTRCRYAGTCFLLVTLGVAAIADAAPPAPTPALVRLGDHELRVGPPWVRGAGPLEAEVRGWVFDAPGGPGAADPPLRLAFLRDSFYFRDEDDLRGFLSDNVDALGKRGGEVVPSTMLVAGVPSEVWRFDDGEGDTVFDVVTYNGELVFLIVVRCPGRITGLPAAVRTLLSSLSLGGKPWSERRLSGAAGTGTGTGKGAAKVGAEGGPAPLASLHERVPKPAWPRVAATPEAPAPAPGRTASPSPMASPAPGPSAADVSARRTAARIAAMQRLGGAVPAQVPAYTDASVVNKAQWAGTVSMAMEGMRLVHGDMNEEEESRFERKWLPLLDHPDQAVLDWCNRANPLLGQLLATRTSLAQAAQEFDAAQLEATAAAGLGDAVGVSDAMEGAAIAAGLLRSLQARLDAVTAEIVALGEPPDAAAAKEGARRRHRKAFALLAPLPIEGEWEDGEGDRTVVKVLRTFDDGLLLVYVAPKTLLEEARRLGVSTAKPGLRFEEEGKGIAVVPGLLDLMEVWEPLGDGRFAALEWTLVPVVTVRDVDQAGQAELTSYTPPNDLDPRPKVVRSDLRLVDPSPKEVPLLDGTTWKQVEDLARSEGDAKASKYRQFKKERPGDYRDGLAGRFTQSRESVRARIMAGYRLTDLEEDVRVAKLMAADRAERAISSPGGPPVDTEALKRKLVAEAEARVRKERQDFLAEIERRVDAELSGEPLASPTRGPSTSGAPDASARESAERAAEEARQKEQVAFHEANVLYFQQNIESLERRIPDEKDPKALVALQRDLLYQRDALQRERDQMETIRTGEPVRTRTELDALNMQMMAQQGRADADRWEAYGRLLTQAPRVIALAPPEEQDALRDFFYRQLDPKAVARGDVEKMARLTKVIGEKVVGRLEEASGRADEKAVDASRDLAYVESVKAVADNSLTLLSLGGGTPVVMTYQAATGFLEGGVGEAVKRTVSGFNVATEIASAAIDGYQKGVLDNLESYAADPQRVKLDESRSGWAGAAWGAGEAAAMAVVMHLGQQAFGVGGSPGRRAGDGGAGGRRPTFGDAMAEVRFRQAQEDGRSLVRAFQDRAAALAAAGKSRAPRDQLAALRAEAEAAYRAVKTSFHAKMQLNALGRSGDTKTIHAYQSLDRSAMRRLQTRFQQRMAAQGWSEQTYRTFSNSASKGKAGMDIDLGAVEPARSIRQGDRWVPNPAHAEWRRSLTQRSPGGLVFSRSPQDLQKAGQHELEQAFREVYGRPSGEAFVNFTTSYHPEAYRDPAWLGKSWLKTAHVAEIDPRWAQQATDVTGYKVNSLPKEHPSLGRYEALQEQCRGIVKDFDTKLAPLLSKAKNPEAAAHMKQLREVMDRFARNEIGPVEADRTIRLLTGGEGMAGVQDRFRVMVQGLAGPMASKR